MENFYRTQFLLKYHHKWDFTEQDNMIPWEREIFLALLKNQIEKEQEEAKQKGYG